MTPEDADRLVDLFHHLSRETIYKRFHALLDNLTEERIHREATRLAHTDPRNQVALIALHNGHAVGVARFHQIAGSREAEAAIVIRDDYQREGLGTFLLGLLKERALVMDITHLTAIVQAQNHPILKVIARSGLQCRWRVEQGETYLAVDIRSG